MRRRRRSFVCVRVGGPQQQQHAECYHHRVVVSVRIKYFPPLIIGVRDWVKQQQPAFFRCPVLPDFSRQTRVLVARRAFLLLFTHHLNEMNNIFKKQGWARLVAYHQDVGAQCRQAISGRLHQGKRINRPRQLLLPSSPALPCTLHFIQTQWRVFSGNADTAKLGSIIVSY